MNLFDNIKSWIDSSGLTNPSKLYTPFAAFCTFFAIYFNAEFLGEIFLSKNWEVQKTALSTINDKNWFDWAIFILKTFFYSITALAMYGLAQAISAGIWALFNAINIKLSYLADSSKYVFRTELDEALKRIDDLCKSERELSNKISEYHNWSPLRVESLKKDHEILKKDHDELKNNFENLKDENENLNIEYKNIEKTKDRLFEDFKKQNKSESSYYKSELKNSSDKILAIIGENRFLNGRIAAKDILKESFDNPKVAIDLLKLSDVFSKPKKVPSNYLDESYGHLCEFLELFSLGQIYQEFNKQGDLEYVNFIYSFEDINRAMKSVRL